MIGFVYIIHTHTHCISSSERGESLWCHKQFDRRKQRLVLAADFFFCKHKVFVEEGVILLKMTSLNVLNVPAATCTLAHFALLFTFTSGLWIGHFFFSLLVLLAWIFCHKSCAITLWIWFKEFSFNRTKKHLCTKMWYDYRKNVSVKFPEWDSAQSDWILFHFFFIHISDEDPVCSQAQWTPPG